MSRFLYPSSVRYGSLEDWAVLGETVDSAFESREFLKYIESIIYKEMTLDLGTIIGESRISYGKNVIKVAIPLYDRGLELSLKEKFVKGIEETVLYDRLLLVQKLFVEEGYKYFGMPVEVEYYFFRFCEMPSFMVARYAAYNLEQNYALTEVFRRISEELWGRKRREGAEEAGGLAHRRRSVLSGDAGVFKGRFIGNHLLLGYRLDCVGRFSRKQRASKESRRIGSVSLGSFKGSVDYGSATVIMTYGVSNVRIWKYLDRYEKEWNYLLKVK